MNPQSSGDGENLPDADIALAALDIADVIGVKLAAIAEFLLAETLRVAQPPHFSPEPLQFSVDGHASSVAASRPKFYNIFVVFCPDSFGKRGVCVMNDPGASGSFSGSLPDLGQLADDLREIGEALNLIAARQAQRNDAMVYQVSISAPCVLTILYVRRLRTQFIGEVPDPLWWMMLTILATRLDGGRLSVKELGEACGLSPRATACRLRKLEKAGFVEFHTPSDKARPLVDLTEQTASRIQHYLDTALQISPWLL
jgi:hypothetical protein